MSDIKLDTKKLEQLAAGIGKDCEEIMVALAFEIEAGAKSRAAVDTGAMRASIYTVTKTSDGYGSAQSAAKSANGKAALSPHPKPSGNVVAAVGPSVEYAGHVELGTSKMAAQPFLVPAVEDVAGKLNSGETWRRLFE